MAVERYENAEVLARAAAERFVRAAAGAIHDRGRFLVALSGGRTPESLYRLLSTSPFRERVSWMHVEFFWGDERAVPPHDPQSNFRMANEAMLKSLGIEARRIHPIDAAAGDPVTVAGAYQRAIASVFGVEAGAEPPRFDLVLLGLGADAHTASLFPGTEALREDERWVAANRVPALQTVRFTLTPPILNRARLVVFLVAGAEKARALRNVLEGPFDPLRCPAQLIRPQGQLVWMVDQSAAGELARPNVRSNRETDVRLSRPGGGK